MGGFIREIYGYYVYEDCRFGKCINVISKCWSLMGIWDFLD